MTDSSSSPNIASSILSSNNTSLYDVLGVSDSADKTEIAKAYRQKSLLLHPDRLTEDQKKNAEESKRALQLVQDAYTTLNDDQKRNTYDFARKVGVSAASQEALNQLHMNVATNLLFKTGGLFGGSSGTNNGSSSSSPKPAPERKCSCGKALKNPDDLLCESCGLFKPKNRCQQMGCLNNLPTTIMSDDVTKKRTEKASQMCDKCALRRKCEEWGCMKKVEAVDRDVCEKHMKK